jgi:hypothetical protein
MQKYHKSSRAMCAAQRCCDQFEVSATCCALAHKSTKTLSRSSGSCKDGNATAMAVSAKKKAWPPGSGERRIRGVAIHLDIWDWERECHHARRTVQIEDGCVCEPGARNLHGAEANGNADGNLVYLYAETRNKP